MGPEPHSLLFEPACRMCGKRAVRLEIIPPDVLPPEWDDWDPARREAFTRWRGRADGYVVRYEGIEAGSGPFGTPISEQEARDIMDALSPTFDFEAVHRRWYDDLGYCAECQAFYCFTHWSSRYGYGHCPRGHGKSLDPHWAPEEFK